MIHRPPDTIPRDLSALTRQLVRAIASGDDGREVREELASTVMIASALSDLAARERLMREIQASQPMEGVAVRLAFGQTMREAIDDFVARHTRLASTADEVAALYGSERAFSIAGVAVDDLLREAKQVLENALRTGEVGDSLHQRMQTVLPFTSARVETIWRTNIASAYAAGRQQHAASTPAIVGFERVATRDRRTRPNHAAAHGLVYSKTDPNVGWYTLPFGYQCRCSDAPLSRTRAKRLGLIGADGNMLTPPWPAAAHPDPGFETGGPAMDLYGA